MEQAAATKAFATLGHSGRLGVFRLLMRFAPRGVRPTEIAAALGMRQNTLSHHLADLTVAGLARVERHGRSLYYSVDLDTTESLIGYLALDVGRARPQLLAPFTDTPGRPLPAPSRVLNVLFICSGNSARSLFAEALLRDLGEGRFAAHSAGTKPGSQPNAFALDVLRRHGHDTGRLHSKDISLFQQDGAPVMDFVFTVCDMAASQECPPWSGQPITGHWGLPDPVGAPGDEAAKMQAFERAYLSLRRRISAFVALPFGALDRMSLQALVDEIDARALQED